MSDYYEELRRPILVDREQYLVVHYSTLDDCEIFKGWVRLSNDGLTVSARKQGGRRWFQLCKAEQVVLSRMLDWAQR
jgi:hypothetical protein